MNCIGERLKVARESCGLTQKELAEHAAVPLSTVSDIEVGRNRNPSADKIAAIAEATGFPPSFFSCAEELPVLHQGNYRKLARGMAKERKKLLGQTRVILGTIQRAEGFLSLPDVRISPENDVASLDDIEVLVNTVRASLQVDELGVLGNVMRAAERAGVVVARLPGEIEDHDSFSAWPDFVFGGRPIIVLTGGHPGDRDRFNVAHELGHLILHTRRQGVEPKQAEIEAHRFAGALLLPKRVAKRALRTPVTLQVLMDVKASYGISMAAAAKRAFDLKIIGRPQFQSIHKQLSARKWKKNEPVDVPQEQPYLLPKIIDALSGGGSVLERAERVSMPVFTFQALTWTG